MMVQDEEDGIRVLLADVLYRVGYGLIGLLAGQGAIDEIVDHVYDNEGAVFHEDKVNEFSSPCCLNNHKVNVNL